MIFRLLKNVSGLLAAFYACLLLLASVVDPEPLPALPFFDKGPREVLVIAHRGGPHLGAESTMPLYKKVAALGVDVLEMDVHASADGELIVAHDAKIDRVTDGTGRIDSLTLAQLRQFDAGYHWSLDGINYPLRGKGLTMPTVEEIFTNLPDMRFVVELKAQGKQVAESLCRTVRQHDMQNKVAVASFDNQALTAFRQACPEVVTSGSMGEVATFWALHVLRLDDLYVPPFRTFMVPIRFGRLTIIDERFMAMAHRRNLAVQVWTIDEPAQMRWLIELGVNGIMTDRPAELISLLDEKILP